MKLLKKNYNRTKMDSFYTSYASKKIIALFGLAVMLQSGVFAQSSCSKFYPFTKGTNFQITSYDRKGKPVATANYVVKNVQSINNTEVAAMSVTIKDDKGKTMGNSGFNITCDGNGVSVDFNSLMNSELFKQFKNLKYKITGKNSILPNNLSIGQSLPDANMKMEVDMSGFKMHMEVNILNRKVVGKEKVTTPAGTFNCFVITYTSEMKSIMNRVSTDKLWIAEGVGLVKQEDYNQRGKVVSSSMLTAINKN